MAAPPDLDPAGVAELGAALRENVRRAVKVSDEVVRDLLVALVAEGHVLIEDHPGVGKTALARALSRSLEAEYARIQCTADLLPADVVGANVFNQREARFDFHPGPVFANVILVDEINRASPKTQSALLECMEEGQVTVDGSTRALPQPFMIIATQNPVEYEGTFPLPEAQLDRFAVRVRIGYPPPREEAAMILDLAAQDPVELVAPVASEPEILAARSAAERVHADPALADYVVALSAATRSDARAQLGASPRAGLALLRAAKAQALLEGRGFVLPEDVKSLAVPVLSHRLILTPDARARGARAYELVVTALDAVPVPL